MVVSRDSKMAILLDRGTWAWAVTPLSKTWQWMEHHRISTTTAISSKEWVDMDQWSINRWVVRVDSMVPLMIWTSCATNPNSDWRAECHISQQIKTTSSALSPILELSNQATRTYPTTLVVDWNKGDWVVQASHLSAMITSPWGCRVTRLRRSHLKTQVVFATLFVLPAVSNHVIFNRSRTRMCSTKDVTVLLTVVSNHHKSSHPTLTVRQFLKILTTLTVSAKERIMQRRRGRKDFRTNKRRRDRHMGRLSPIFALNSPNTNLIKTSSLSIHHMITIWIQMDHLIRVRKGGSQGLKEIISKTFMTMHQWQRI